MPTENNIAGSYEAHTTGRAFDCFGEDCYCGGDRECLTCEGSGWAYMTTTPCDYCDGPVVVAMGVRPTWSLPTLESALCDDCERERGR